MMKFEPPHVETNKMIVCPAKTQISLGFRPVWSESRLSTWRHLGSLATQWAHSEDSDQTGRMPRLIWVFAGRTDHIVGFVVRRLISYLCCLTEWGSIKEVCTRLPREVKGSRGEGSVSETTGRKQVRSVSWLLLILAGAWQNHQDDLCAQRRLRSTWASAQSDPSLGCPFKPWRRFGS